MHEKPDTEWLVGGGELGERIRAKNWAETPLGPREQWSASLRLLVNLVVGSHQAMALLLGDDWLLLYNDAYRAIAADKHPAALGQPSRAVWREVWESGEPVHAAVMQRGESVRFENRRYVFHRHDATEEVFLTVSLDPLRDEDGSVCAALVVCEDTTARVAAQAALKAASERDSYLLALFESLRELSEPEGIMRTAARMLGEKLNVARALYATAIDAETVLVRCEWVNGEPSFAGARTLPGNGGLALAALERGEDLVIDDVSTDPRVSAHARAAFDALGARAGIASSLVKQGRWVGAFVVYSLTPRVWTALERTLVRETAERTWAALERAEVEDRLRNSERMLDEAQRVARLGSWELDLLTGSVRWSRQAYANYGVSPDTFTPSITAFRSFVHPDDRERVEQAASEVMSKAAPVDIEYRIVAGDGVTRVLHARGEVTRVEPDGTPRVMTGVAQDVTERRQKEEQQRLYEQSQARMRDLDALERLQSVGARLVGDEEQDGLLGEILEAAIAIAEADFGNIQVLDPETSELRIVAQRGFPAQWVEFWDRASKGHGACGTAIARGERVIIEDVSTSEVFDTEMREVQLGAGVLAVQSTPLVSRSGAPLGVISTHYRSPRRPSERALRLVDLLARQTADFLERNAKEAALRRSEAIASSILMTSADAILSLDAEHRIVRFNTAAEAIFGYEAAEVLGGPLDLLLPAPMREAHRRHVGTFALGPPTSRRMGARGTVKGRRKSGEEFPADVSLSNVLVGREHVLTAVVRDMTEERKLSARLELLANGSPAVLYACTATPPYAATFVGANVREQFGYDPEQLTAEPDLWIRNIHPDDRERVLSELGALSRTGRHVVEYRIRKADGSESWVHDEVSINGSSANTDGELIGFLTDVTARRNAEAALEAREAQTRFEERLLSEVGSALNPLDSEAALRALAALLARALGDYCSVFALDAAGSLQRVASESRDPANALLAHRMILEASEPSATHPVAKSFAEVTPVLMDLTAEHYERFAQSAEHLQMLLEAAPKQCAAVPLPLPDRCVGVIGLASRSRAYTEQDMRLLEEIARRCALFVEDARLREAERRATRLRDEVLGVVAHDLRNPLNALVLQASSLSRDDDERRNLKPVAAITRAAQRMNRIIEDLLDVTRLESGTLALDLAPVAPAALLTQIAAAERPLFEARSLTLSLDLGRGLPDVMVDAHRVQQILENLLSNALKFTTSGQVVLGAKASPDGVVFTVSDTGRGIREEELPHVFERFWQARKKTRSGAGLGLAIVQGLVEAHGGRVWAETAPGRGTTFSFTLPAARQATPQVEVPGKVTEPPTTVGMNRTLLVAEDDPEVQEALREVLTAADYEVAMAGNGAEALERARKGPRPQAVILDLEMPGVDGWAFLEERRRDPSLHAIPVIVVSAQRDVRTRLEQERVAYLPKPVVAQRLVAELRSLELRA